MKVEFIARDKFSAVQNSALDALRAAVYPPEVIASLPGRFFSWAPPQGSAGSAG